MKAPNLKGQLYIQFWIGKKLICRTSFYDQSNGTQCVNDVYAGIEALPFICMAYMMALHNLTDDNATKASLLAAMARLNAKHGGKFDPAASKRYVQKKMPF